MSDGERPTPEPARGMKDSPVSEEEVLRQLDLRASMVPLTEVFQQVLPCSEVKTAAFFPGASSVALGGFNSEGGKHVDRDLLIWDLLRGREIEGLPGSERGCGTLKLAVSLDGRYIAYAGWPDMPACLHIRSVDPPASLSAEEIFDPPVQALSFSLDGLLAIGLPHSLYLRRPGTADEPVYAEPGPWSNRYQDSLDLAFSPSGRRFVVSRHDDGVRHIDSKKFPDGALNDKSDGPAWKTIHEPPWSAVHLFDSLHPEQILRGYALKEAASRVLMLDETNVIVGSKNGTVGLFSLVEGKFLKTCPAHDSPITALALDPSRRYLASASQAGDLLLLNLEGFGIVCGVDIKSRVVALAFEPGGLLVSAGVDGIVRTWDCPRKAP